MAELDGDGPLEGSTCGGERRRRYALFVQELRCCEPIFAEASALQPATMREWQSAVYLLTGCRPVWRALGGPIMHERSIAPVTRTLARGSPRGSSTERAVMLWAGHFWDPSRDGVRFPHVFDELHFRRWMTAALLRRGCTPIAPPSTADLR